MSRRRTAVARRSARYPDLIAVLVRGAGLVFSAAPQRRAGRRWRAHSAPDPGMDWLESEGRFCAVQLVDVHVVVSVLGHVLDVVRADALGVERRERAQDVLAR